MSSSYTNETVIYEPNQQMILALIPIFTGTLSALGSCVIIYTICTGTAEKVMKKCRASTARRSKKTTGYAQSNKLTTYHRILLGFSTIDVIASIRAATSTFLMPAGTPGVWHAHGTTGTCSAQGFITQLGLARTIYSASLALYFALSIHPDIHEDIIAKIIEPLIHFITLGFAVLTAIAGLFLEAYNPVPLGIGCWVGAYPMGCLDEGSNIECTRGKNAKEIMWYFGGYVVIICFLVIILCMAQIYFSAWWQIRKMEQRYANEPGVEQGRSNSATTRLRKISTQAFFYIGSFFLCYIWPSIGRIQETNGNIDGFFLFSFFSQIFFPLEGLFNCLIYMRPYYIEVKQKNDDMPRIDVVKTILGFKQFEKPNINTCFTSASAETSRGIDGHQNLGEVLSPTNPEKHGYAESVETLSVIDDNFIEECILNDQEAFNSSKVEK